MKENNINNYSFDRNDPIDITALYKFNNKKYEDIYPIILSTIGFIVDGGKEKFILKQFKDGKIKCIINKNIPARLANIKVIKDGKKIKLFNIIEDDLVDILFNHANFIPFSPLNIPKCKEKTFNLYTGNDINYIDNFIVNEELINPILNHIKILTNNEEKSYDYVIKWLSKIIKSPERKTGVCPVFISDQGAGKTSFFEWFGHNMVGKDWTLTINNNENIFNRFNSELNNKCFTILDEAQLDGSYKKKADQLKSLITQLYQRIECKGIDSTIIDDKNNYVILTNNDFPVKVEQSDRRFAVFNVSNEKIGDDIYFKNLNKAFNDEDVQINFYHYLLNLDIKNFNPEKEIPETEAKTELKKESAPSPVRFVIDIIKNGIKDPEFNFLNTSSENTDKFNTEKLYECYKNYMNKKCPNERLLVENGFILKLNKLLNIKTNKIKGNKITILNKDILKNSICNYFKIKDIKEIHLTDFEYSDSGIESDGNTNENLDIYIDNNINICVINGCNKNKYNMNGIHYDKCMTHLLN